MTALPVRERAHDIVDVLRELAAGHDSSVAQVALAWVRQQPGVTTTLVGGRPRKLNCAAISSPSM